jgi:polyferredoxin
VRLAAQDPQRRPVLISGEPGLEKDNLAALIHYGSAQRQQLILRFDGALLKADGSEVFGTGPDAVELPLLELARSGQWCAGGITQTFAGRLFFTAESSLPALDRGCTLIRVPPLRVRRQGQDWPAVLPDDVFWTAPRQQRLRIDIWRWKPQLREWTRAPWLWNGLLFGLVSWLFVLVNLWLWLWLGPQDRHHNGVVNLFWAWWWPLILLGFPLVGRLWCSFCPLMVWREISQRLARHLGWQPQRWPRGDSDSWASPLLAVGFALILLWEELCNLQNTAWLSSCLLLLITAGAVIGSLRFEKRFWCRYLCPVGGMNGLFAKLAITELRAQVGTCSGSSSTYACFKGGPVDGEGLATAGCPLGTHPAHLADNRNCVLCLTCVQACPHRSVQLALRPPAADIQREMNLPPGEPGLLLVLAGDVCLHHSQRLLGWSSLAPTSLVEGPWLPRLAAATLALAVPSALFLYRVWWPPPPGALIPM